MFSEDPSIFLADFGVPVAAGAVSGIDYLLTVPTALFGGLGYGDVVTVDGVSYKAESQPLRFDDGTFCRVPLVKQDPDPAIDYILDGGAALASGTIYDGGGA